MKKFILTILFSIYLSFNIIGLTPALTNPKTYKQGIYSLSDFNISKNNTYSIRNSSKTNDIRVLIFDENYLLLQNVSLPKNTLDIDTTLPLNPEYSLVVIGNGELTITPKQS